MSQPNKYTPMVKTYYREYFPEQVADLDDPEEFYCQRSSAMAAMVEELIPQIAGDDPPGEGYLDKVGRLNASVMRAEEIARAEILPVPGENPQG